MRESVLSSAGQRILETEFTSVVMSAPNICGKYYKISQRSVPRAIPMIPLPSLFRHRPPDVDIVLPPTHRTRRDWPQHTPLELPQNAPPDFPVYPLLWHPIRTRVSCLSAPEGRVVGVEYSYDYQPSDSLFQASLGPNDVVWVPLYEGTILAPGKRRDTPRAEYDDNLEAIAQVALVVRAVLVGNANAEIHHNVSRRGEEWELCSRFITRHGTFVGQFGRPAFAPILELLVFDCFERDGKLRDLLNAQNALLLCFAGSGSFFERANDPRLPEPPPYPTFSAYLKTMEAWSGVGLQRGLDNGSGTVLQKMGFRAGFMGYF